MFIFNGQILVFVLMHHKSDDCSVLISSFLISHCNETLPRQSDAEACSAHRAEWQDREGCRNTSWTTLSPQCFSSSKQMAPLPEWPGRRTPASRAIECLGRVRLWSHVSLQVLKCVGRSRRVGRSHRKSWASYCALSRKQSTRV